MTDPHSTPTSQDGPRIVVGVDGSPTSVSALQWALRQALLTGAHLDAVACWERPNTAYGMGVYVDFDLDGATHEVLKGALEAAVTATPGADAVQVSSTVVEGYPARVLVERAAGAELLVVGSRGHGEFSGMLLGSVGLHAASHSPCPVVILRT